jgi:hypothetical protein
MTHYEKLGALIFRLSGVVLLIFSLISTIWIFAISSFAVYTFLYFTAVPALLIGIALFAFSRSLAKLVCFDFEKNA